MIPQAATIEAMPDILLAVKKEMKRRKWSVYRLVQELKGKRADGGDVQAAIIYRFLANKTTVNSRDLGLILDVLELEIRPRE